MRQKNIVLICALALLIVGASQTASAQQTKRIIQLSGVVIQEDSLEGRAMGGVHVYVPKAGRGTTTNHVGFFSMPVLVSDEVVVSLIGYKRQSFVVPENSPEYSTIIITLKMDTVMLPTITIMAFPTEEVFKEAVLALNLPENQAIDQKNLNQELLALMVRTAPMDASMNNKYYLDQWAASQGSKFMPVTNPFLNPFNWVRFFNSLKKKDDKKKK